jgi:hypothetical protein
MNSSRYFAPSRALRRSGVKFDNIALVPASLLPFRKQYEAVIRKLPHGTVLLVLPRGRSATRTVLVKLAGAFAAHGHQIATRTAEEVRRL